MDERARAEAVRQVAAGDGDALQRLLVFYHGALRRVVVGGLDGAAAGRLDPDDILQEAYVGIYGAVSSTTFDGPAPFYRWLETVTRNTLKNQIRDLKRQKRNPRREVAASTRATGSYPDLLATVAHGDPTPSRQVGRQESVAVVMSSLARLTTDQRAVVQLRYLEGLPASKVALRLGKNEDAVHALCYRALKALRGHLGTMSRYLSNA